MGRRGLARLAAKDQDVSLGGGANTIQQYLRAGLVDELRIHVTPILLGRGEPLFDNLDGGPSGYECVGLTCSSVVAHYTYRRKA